MSHPSHTAVQGHSAENVPTVVVEHKVPAPMVAPPTMLRVVSADSPVGDATVSFDVWAAVANVCAFLHAKMSRTETFNDTVNFFNPFFNHFGNERIYKGKRMDYFGYLAHRMTGSVPI